MTLRTKLVISFTTLLLIVIVVFGFVATRSLQTILIDQIDTTLTSFADRGPGPGPGDGPGPADDDHQPDLRPVAEVVVDAEGSIVFSRPSGFSDEPDPLPDVSSIEGEGFTYLDSVAGSLRYRAHVTDLENGGTAVRAIPLDDVSAATASLVTTLVIAGMVVLVIGGAATWWTVDRSMRPIAEMVDTAEAIAAGDLSRRVPEADPTSELGRLGVSLNEMLAHIDVALTSEREGRERLRRFVADASHELRTPITAISGYAELHRRGGLEDPEAEERAWTRIEAEGKRMGLLIEDLLTLARLGEGQTLDIANVDLAQVARDAATDHTAIDPGRPISVVGESPVEVRGDGARLHQVVSNLLSNVRVHTPVGTLVTVDVATSESWAILSVIDDGPGIPPEAIDHIFDRFYRADPSRSRRSGGSGLGLSIVSAIVEAHGGTVEAGNDVGGGARFTVRLPRKPTLSA